MIPLSASAAMGCGLEVGFSLATVEKNRNLRALGQAGRRAYRKFTKSRGLGTPCLEQLLAFSCLPSRPLRWSLQRMGHPAGLPENPARFPSRAFPNPRFRTSPCWAAGTRVDGRACTLVRDGGLRGKSCSKAFPCRRAKAWPSHLCEMLRCGVSRFRVPHRAFRRSGKRFRLRRCGPAAVCSLRDSVGREFSGAERSAGSIYSGRCACG